MSKSKTIETLVGLLAKCEEYNAELYDGQGKDLDFIDELTAKLAEAELKIAELQDDNTHLQHQVIDAAEQRDAAIKRARVWEEKLEELLNSLESSSDFISDVADMVADEDLLALKQTFGIDDSPTFIPEYLETEADYESAPMGTEVLYYDYEEIDPRTPTYFHTRVAGGWEDNDTGYVYGSEVVAGHARKVLQWGSR